MSLTAQIVSAHVENNPVPMAQVPALIREVHRALATAGEPAEPAVAPKKSVFPGHIVCFECGTGYKLLKRHILTDHGLTPQAYRAKWRLPRPTRWWPPIMP